MLLVVDAPVNRTWAFSFHRHRWGLVTNYLDTSRLVYSAKHASRSSLLNWRFLVDLEHTRENMDHVTCRQCLFGASADRA